MKNPNPDRAEAFAIYLSLISQSRANGSLPVREVADIAISLAKAFADQWQIANPPRQVTNLTQDRIEAYGGFELSNQTIHFCSYDGQRLPLFRYPSEGLAFSQIRQFDDVVRAVRYETSD